jgi:protoporphyrinogen oxidase
MKVAVLGAGVAGLTAAYRLGRNGHEAVVYERWPGLGGQAATIDVGDGVRLERYYHALVATDREIVELCEELGIGDELTTWPSSLGMFYGGRLYPFTSPLDLLRYKPMSPLARLRMGFAVFLLQRRAHDLEPFERLTIKEWVEDKMGHQAWETVWGPMLRGKFGDQAGDISMSWLWAKLRTRRPLDRDQAKEEKLLYPRHSFEVIFRRLEERIKELGGEVLIDRPAARVEREPEGGFLVHAGAPGSFRRGHDPREFDVAGDPDRFDAVIGALPTDIFEQVLNPALRDEVGDAYLERANSIEYYEALCLLVETDRRFHPYFWTNVADEDMRFIGLIELTNLVGPEHYGGRHFMYVANYLPRGHEWLSLEMDELWELYEPGLRRINPDFSQAWVKQSWRFREPAAQPVVLPNYRDRMPPYETGVPGLLMANTTQVYPEDRGTNYAVRQAGEVVAALLAGHDDVTTPAAAESR